MIIYFFALILNVFFYDEHNFERVLDNKVTGIILTDRYALSTLPVLDVTQGFRFEQYTVNN